MNDYEAKQQAKRERLERAAEKAEDRASFLFDAARDAVAGIPFGQPILVGHHSEGRHRNALKRSDSRMRRGVEESKHAEDLARRAAAVGTGGISSDDPEAIAKLHDKRTELEKKRDHMKIVNALYRKADRDGLSALELDYDALKVKCDGAYSWEQQPFAAWQLTNIGARIRQAAKRTAELAGIDRKGEPTTETIASATITTDPAENRVCLRFPERLSKEDYKRVRSAGFVWSPTRGAFVRKLTNTALHHARALAESLGKTA